MQFFDLSALKLQKIPVNAEKSSEYRPAQSKSAFVHPLKNPIRFPTAKYAHETAESRAESAQLYSRTVSPD